MSKSVLLALASVALLCGSASAAWAQSPSPEASATQGPPTICGVPVPAPANLPPAGSGPVIYQLAPCFLAQGNVSSVEPQTYLYYMQLRPSQPSQNLWVPWDEQAERTAIADFRQLWATGFLADLSIELTDYTFSNGVIGKLVTYNMEERERVKIVNYDGTEKINRADIDEQLRARGIEMRLDSFLDAGTIRRIESVLREMMADKGFTDAAVSHEVTAVAGGPKLVNVSFTIGDGPKVKIRDIEFVGNVAKSDRTLQRKMKDNKTPGFFWFHPARRNVPGLQVRERRGSHPGLLSQRRVCAGAGRPAGAQGPRRVGRWQDAVGAAHRPCHGGCAVPSELFFP